MRVIGIKWSNGHGRRSPLSPKATKQMSNELHAASGSWCLTRYVSGINQILLIIVNYTPLNLLAIQKNHADTVDWMDDNFILRKWIESFSELTIAWLVLKDFLHE